MNILWLSWKDLKNPTAGGAELVNHELTKRLARDGHRVIFLVAGFRQATPREERDGYTVIRVGNRWTVYWKANSYYRRHLRNWPDLIIDEVNTIPFFAKWYGERNNILFVHQLCREIWFYQMPLPLSLIGFFLEPLYLWLLRDRQVITVSESTKNDLLHYGFKARNISVITEGIDLKPVAELEVIAKYTPPTILSLGAVRSMKRTHHVLKAFELARRKIPDLRLLIGGEVAGKYGQAVRRLIRTSPATQAVTYLGKIDDMQKVDLLQKSHLLCVTSVKEGWGLVVTEANSQGTPAIVYDVDGLRDSVRNGQTGRVCEKNTPQAMADALVLLLMDPEAYNILRRRAWEWSKSINFEKSYADFVYVLEQVWSR